MGNQWPQPLQAYWKTMGFDSPVFNYTLFLTGLNTCGSRDRACLSARFICCRYGDNVNESQTLPRAGIRAVATETGSVPSCRKQQRKHAVSTVTLSTPEQNKKKKSAWHFSLHFALDEKGAGRVGRHMTPCADGDGHGGGWCLWTELPVA